MNRLRLPCGSLTFIRWAMPATCLSSGLLTAVCAACGLLRGPWGRRDEMRRVDNRRLDRFEICLRPRLPPGGEELVPGSVDRLRQWMAGIVAQHGIAREEFPQRPRDRLRLRELAELRLRRPL